MEVSSNKLEVQCGKQLRAAHVARPRYTGATVEWWERAKERRLDERLGQEDVAGKSGLSVSRISDLERGRVKNPTLDTLQRLAKGLGVSVAYLIGESSAVPQKSETPDLIRPANVLQQDHARHNSEIGVSHDAETETAPGYVRLRAELQDALARLNKVLTDHTEVADRDAKLRRRRTDFPRNSGPQRNTG